MLETSSSCSFTNHWRKLRVMWSFSLMARSTSPLICLVTVSSHLRESATHSSAVLNPDLGAGIAGMITEPPASTT